MLGFFIILMIIGFTARIMNRMQMEQLKRCSIHKWVYENNRLICSECRKTPEQNISSNEI